MSAVKKMLLKVYGICIKNGNILFSIQIFVADYLIELIRSMYKELFMESPFN